VLNRQTSPKQVEPLKAMTMLLPSSSAAKTSDRCLIASLIYAERRPLIGLLREACFICFIDWIT
jgi:hypothetical protein